MHKKEVAVVTGASGLIGKSIAWELGNQGYTVVLQYNENLSGVQDLYDTMIKNNMSALLVQADISNYDSVCKLFENIVREYNRLDLLVNNAGISEKGLFLMTSEEEINRVVDINLKGTLFCCKQAAMIMIGNKGGRIINISSVAALRGIEGQCIYASTKGAIVSMTRTMAKEFSRYNINVNSILPGFVESDMLKHIKPEKKEEFLQMIPKKRFGRGDEIAHLVNYLASDLSDYITGQCICIDGGLSI